MLLKMYLDSMEEIRSPINIDSSTFVAAIAGPLTLELKRECLPCALTIQR